MDTVESPLYRACGAALLRAARTPMTALPRRWPDVADDLDVDQCREWLADTWTRPSTVEAVSAASPTLARRIGEISTGKIRRPAAIRSAVISVLRYVLRESGRPTPFGLFAGTTEVEWGPAVKLRWGGRHRAFARADTGWLSGVVDVLESIPELLARLDVVTNNLTVDRGTEVALELGTGTAHIDATVATAAVWRAAKEPVVFADLAEVLAEQFGGVPSPIIREMLTDLVAGGFLLTALRAPATETDPLGHAVATLLAVGADEVAEVTTLVHELAAVAADIERHNHVGLDEQPAARDSAAARMAGLGVESRSRLALDLRLDADLVLPDEIACDLADAASTLARISAQPQGAPIWRDYYGAFIERYGYGAMVPVRSLVNPDTGLGYPATYPGSGFADPGPKHDPDRDARLLALVHEVIMSGGKEIILDDATVSGLQAAGFDHGLVPPHVELAARIHASSLDELDEGCYRLYVSPARAAGTLTARFTTDTAGGLAQQFANLPCRTSDALPAQLSFRPLYPRAENISRGPLFGEAVISLGEHRRPGPETIGLDDLAVVADWQGLRLVSMSLGRPVEPHMLGALAIDKQLPPMARFLTMLPRTFGVAFTEFDWGAAAGLSFLPRVRRGRVVLSPARWRLRSRELPADDAPCRAWRSALHSWARRWRLPEVVELRAADKSLRLDLGVAAQAALLRSHLVQAGEAELIEAPAAGDLAWLGGHAHEIAVPLMTTTPTRASALATTPAPVIPADHGQLPGSGQAKWLFAKVFSHPDHHDTVLATRLPDLLERLDTPASWFIRYRSATETEHLRLRIKVADEAAYARVVVEVGRWAEELRADQLATTLAFDTYFPEIGRYGTGAALAAAEAVFVADSAVASAQLEHVPLEFAHPVALAAVNILDIAAAFLGGIEAGTAWIMARGDDRRVPAPRDIRAQAVALADPAGDYAALQSLPFGSAINEAWSGRRTALAAYAELIETEAQRDTALESLLHVHHNRVIGIDRASEAVCRRLARAAALAWIERSRRA